MAEQAISGMSAGSSSLCASVTPPRWGWLVEVDDQPLADGFDCIMLFASADLALAAADNWAAGCSYAADGLRLILSTRQLAMSDTCTSVANGVNSKAE